MSQFKFLFFTRRIKKSNVIKSHHRTCSTINHVIPDKWKTDENFLYPWRFDDTNNQAQVTFWPTTKKRRAFEFQINSHSYKKNVQGASVGIVARPDLFHNISLSAISFATVGQMLRFRRKWRSLANLIEAFIQSFSNHFARPPRRNIMEKKKRERGKKRDGLKIHR